MIILGIDPGSRNLGHGLIKVNQGLEYVASGTFCLSGEKNFFNRLFLLGKKAQELREGYFPDVVAIESLIYVKSIPSLAKLSQARGAFLGALGEAYRHRIFEYSPNQMKACVSGFGHSGKDNIIKAVQIILSLPPSWAQACSHDEADALGLAISHALLARKDESLLRK